MVRAPVPRVLLLSDQPPQGGLGRYARALYHALLDADRQDLAVDLLLQNVPGRRPAAEWASPSPRSADSKILVQARPRWAKATGYGKAYQYSHEGKGHFIEQEFLPEAISGTVLYQPGDTPREQAHAALIKRLWKDRYDRGKDPLSSRAPPPGRCDACRR